MNDYDVFYFMNALQININDNRNDQKSGLLS